MSNEEQLSEQSLAEKIDLTAAVSKVWKSLRRTWLLGLALVVALGGFTYFRAIRSYSPQYTASASFVVSSGSGSSITASQYYDRALTKQITATFPYILSSGALQKVIGEDLGLGYVPGSISTSMLGDTNLFQLNVTASDPQMAYDILQSVIKNYPVIAKPVIGNTTLKLLDETGVPASPSNSNDPQNAVVRSAGIGLVLYLGILFLTALNQKTVHGKEDLKKYLNTDHLSTVPLVPQKHRSNKRQNSILIDSNTVPGNYFKSIETMQLRLSRVIKRNQWKKFLVTSALAGEGKSTTACNLALMFAQKGYRVLLIDGDMRNPSVYKRLNLPDGEDSKGLYHYLSGKEELTSVIHRYQDTSLFLIPAGASLADVSELYTNGNLEKLLDICGKEMDLVIMDTPPSTFIHDAPLVAPLFDAGILVIRQDYAHVNRIMSCAEILTQSGLPLAGSAIIAEDSGSGKYGYGKYYYGKYGYRRYGNYSRDT